MNSIMLQDTKSIYRTLLHFYTLITNYQKEKLQKIIAFTNATKRINFLGINLIKEVKDL